MSEYLEFERHDPPPDRKTPVVRVLSKRTGQPLGSIAWYGPWRQFCFYPSPETIFNVGCLRDIEDQIGLLMAERRRKP